MNSMRQGFKAQEKSFALVFSDRWLALYVGAVLITVARILYLFTGVTKTYSEYSSISVTAKYLSNLVFLFVPIVLIYRTAALAASKKISSLFSVYRIINIAALLVIEFVFLFNSEKIVALFAEWTWIKDYVDPLLTFAWGTLTFYVLPIVCLEKVNVFQAFLKSAHILRATYKSALGMVICFYLLIALMGLPLSLFALPFLSHALPLWIHYAIPIVVSALAVGVLLIKSIGTTLLYLDYAKELPSHYLK